MFASRISFEHASQEDDGQSDRRRTTSTTSSSRQQSVNSTMRDRAGPVNADSPTSSAESSSMMGPSLSSIAINATIALFGATRANKTARSFVRMALDAGYHVRVLVQSTREFETYENGETGQLRVVAGAMTNEDKIRRVLHKANYVVCMNDTAPSELNSSINVSTFVDLLYPLMKEEPSIRVFLFQVSGHAGGTCDDAKTGHEYLILFRSSSYEPTNATNHSPLHWHVMKRAKLQSYPKFSKQRRIVPICKNTMPLFERLPVNMV